MSPILFSSHLYAPHLSLPARSSTTLTHTPCAAISFKLLHHPLATLHLSTSFISLVLSISLTPPPCVSSIIPVRRPFHPSQQFSRSSKEVHSEASRLTFEHFTTPEALSLKDPSTVIPGIQLHEGAMMCAGGAWKRRKKMGHPLRDWKLLVLDLELSSLHTESVYKGGVKRKGILLVRSVFR